MPIKVLKKDKDKKEEQKEKPKSGSSVKDIFKSYGKYDGKPIELKRGGLTPGLKNYVKKDDSFRKNNSEEALVKAFKKNSNQAIFVKKSEIIKNPGDYTPVEGNLEKMLKPKNKKRGGLSGGQKKLDKNKDGKITGEDFKMMRKGYGAARTSGMGLEDESIKPGKVIKASKGGGADMGRMGEIKSKLALAKDKFKRVMGSRPKLEAPERGPMKPMKKMGGGMMQRPMGYSKGTMVMARGCKLGRKKATKLY